MVLVYQAIPQNFVSLNPGCTAPVAPLERPPDNMTDSLFHRRDSSRLKRATATSESAAGYITFHNVMVFVAGDSIRERPERSLPTRRVMDSN